MANTKHKVFISYHHENDQTYKEALLEVNEKYDIFINSSVDTGDIDDDLDDESIRAVIRDEYLRDSSVTILLVGAETRCRKHIDWEIYSSMYDGAKNKKSGVLVINLPSTGSLLATAAHGEDEKSIIYPNSTWLSTLTRKEYEDRYPYMPDRIMDNLLKSSAKISVTSWKTIAENVENLKFLIDLTHNDRSICDYDLSRLMKRANS